MATRDIAWAATYMRVELDTCGVPPPVEPCVDDSDDQSTLIDSQSSSASPQPSPIIRWNFFQNGWTFLRPGADTETFVAVSDVSHNDIGITPVEFKKLPYTEKKSAAYEKARRMVVAPDE